MVLRNRRGRAGTSVEIPNVKLPSLGRAPRNPPGWNQTEIAIRQEGFEQAIDFGEREPAGEPPEWWSGTRPEWSVYWGLLRNGLHDGEDFTYKAMLPTVGSSYFSNVDFIVKPFGIAIEVQGEFWHYGQGTDKQINDQIRRALLTQFVLNVIFIDESDALRNPKFYVREALAGRDHSKGGSR